MPRRLARHVAFFGPFTAFMGLHFLGGPVHCLPVTQDAEAYQHPHHDPAQGVTAGDAAGHNFTIQITGPKDVVELSEIELVDTQFSEKQFSTLQSFFEAGAHLFDPFIHFLQTFAASEAPAQTSPPSPHVPRDKRMLYIA